MAHYDLERGYIISMDNFHKKVILILYTIIYIMTIILFSVLLYNKNKISNEKYADIYINFLLFYPVIFSLSLVFMNLIINNNLISPTNKFNKIFYTKNKSYISGYLDFIKFIIFDISIISIIISSIIVFINYEIYYIFPIIVSICSLPFIMIYMIIPIIIIIKKLLIC